MSKTDLDNLENLINKYKNKKGSNTRLNKTKSVSEMINKFHKEICGKKSKKMSESSESSESKESSNNFKQESESSHSTVETISSSISEPKKHIKPQSKSCKKDIASKNLTNVLQKHNGPHYIKTMEEIKNLDINKPKLIPNVTFLKPQISQKCHKPCDKPCITDSPKSISSCSDSSIISTDDCGHHDRPHTTSLLIINNCISLLEHLKSNLSIVQIIIFNTKLNANDTLDNVVKSILDNLTSLIDIITKSKDPLLESFLKELNLMKDFFTTYSQVEDQAIIFDKLAHFSSVTANYIEVTLAYKNIIIRQNINRIYG